MLQNLTCHSNCVTVHGGMIRDYSVQLTYYVCGFVEGSWIQNDRYIGMKEDIGLLKLFLIPITI